MDHDDNNPLYEEHVQVDALSVGLTRPATVAGVPLSALLIGEGAVMAAFMTTGKLLFLPLALPVYGVLRLMSASNPRIFAEIAAWARVHGRCRNRAFWGAASFSPRRTTQWEKF